MEEKTQPGQRFKKQEITGTYYIVRFRAAPFNMVGTLKWD